MGGISGIQEPNGNVKKCINNGEIISTHHTGGIIGRQFGTVENCTNNGKIISKVQIAGGITGYMKSGKIINSSNKGFIQENGEDDSDGDQVDGMSGGIVGYVDGENIEITRVYNSGKVMIKNREEIDVDSVGGIIGGIENGKKGLLKYAYNKGELEGGDYIGAIVGNNKVSESVSNCYYYLPDGSSLSGIGESNEAETGYFLGTEGNKNYNYNSLEEFINGKGIPTEDN